MLSVRAYVKTHCILLFKFCQHFKESASIKKKILLVDIASSGASGQAVPVSQADQFSITCVANGNTGQ